MSLRAWTGRYLLVGVVVIVAGGYALYERALTAGTGGVVTHGDLVVGLTSNYQLDAFVLLPAWLLSGCLSLRPSFRAERLVRGGSWLALTRAHLGRRLRSMLIASVCVALVWVATTAGLSSFVSGHVRFTSALLALVLDCLAHLLLLAGIDGALVGCYILGLRVGYPALAAVCVWVWALFGLVGAFPQGAATNLLAYGNAVDLLMQPQLIGWLIAGTCLALGLAATVALARDSRRSPRGGRMGLVGITLAAVVLAGALATPARADALGSGFFGYDGSFVGYLPGGVIVALSALVGLSEVHRRWESVRFPSLLRSGSDARWLLHAWGRGSVRTTVAGAAALLILGSAQAFTLGFQGARTVMEGIAVLIAGELWFTIGLLVLTVGASVVQSVTAVLLCFALGSPALPTGVALFAPWTAPFAPTLGILVGALAVAALVGARLVTFKRFGLTEGWK